MLTTISMDRPFAGEAAPGIWRPLLSRFPQSWPAWWPILLIGALGCLLAPLYLNRAYSVDEVWFYDVAQVGSKQISERGFANYVVTQENDLGYGAIYWIAYSAVAHGLSDPRPVARLFALLAMISVPCCAAVYAKRTGTCYGWFALLMWASFPLCWWTGKVSGPETFSMSLAVVGVTVLLMACQWQSLFVGALLIGMAVGIKSTAAPIVVLAAFIVAGRIKPWWRSLLMLGAGTILGFVVANPILVFHPHRFVANLTKVASISATYDIPRFSWEYAKYLYSNSIWEWDTVFRGGFFDWGLALPALALWLLFLWLTCDRRVLVGFLAMLGCATLLFMAKSRFYGWYWFPMLALMPLLTCEANGNANRTKTALAVAILLLNLAANSGLIQQQVDLKLQRIAELGKGAAISQFVKEKIPDEGFDLKSIVWYLPPGVVTPSQITSIRSNHKKVASVLDRSAYEWLARRRYKKLKPGQASCVVFNRSMMPSQYCQTKLQDLLAMTSDFDFNLIAGPEADLLIVSRPQ